MPGPYSVTIPAGVTSASFSIQIIDDNIPENDETFVIAINSSSLPNGVTIANPAQAAQADSSGQASVGILDDDRKL